MSGASPVTVTDSCTVDRPSEVDDRLLADQQLQAGPVDGANPASSAVIRNVPMRTGSRHAPAAVGDGLEVVSCRLVHGGDRHAGQHAPSNPSPRH